MRRLQRRQLLTLPGVLCLNTVMAGRMLPPLLLKARWSQMAWNMSSAVSMCLLSNTVSFFQMLLAGHREAFLQAILAPQTSSSRVMV